MPHSTLVRCPVCSGDLKVTELSCAACDTRIKGKFDTCRFCALPKEHMDFIMTFLRCEGNLSRVQGALNISYFVARNRLAAAVATLNLPEPSGTDASRETSSRSAETRAKVLQDLAEGRLDVAQAAEAIKQLPS